MGRPKRFRAPVPMPYHCGMCDQSFSTRIELANHTADHADSAPTTLPCPVCAWPFPDSLALEEHRIQSGHGSAPFSCDTCGKVFTSQQNLEKHLKPPFGCMGTSGAPPAAQTFNGDHKVPPSNGQSDKTITCDRCPKIFRSRREYNAHRSFPDGECADHKKRTPPKKRPGPTRSDYVDPDQPHQMANDMLRYDDASDTPDDVSENDEYCHDCKTVFDSKARFNAHALRCSMQSKSNGQFANSSKTGSVAPTSFEVRQPTIASVQKHQTVDAIVPAPKGPRSLAEPVPSPRPRPPAPASNQPSSNLSSAPSPDFPSFVCSTKGCGKSFRSDAGLKVHQTDVHGIGGKALDLHGSHSFMLNPRMREQLKAQGLLRQPPPGPSRGRGRGGRAAPLSSRPLAPTPPRASPTFAGRLPPPIPTGMLTSSPVPIGLNMGGDAEIEQAKYIQGKILRLLIQSDIFIHHNGKMTVCGIDWTRIGVSRQHDAVELFDGMCHLPKILQGEYLPPPTTFKDEYKASYPVADFTPSPTREASNPGLGVVALSCSKILLADGRQDLVKLAAIDLVSSRILINHLVCTDPHAQVADWRTSLTGLSSWYDMDAARQAGYKVFKGWAAARSALCKFVDKDTIIVGHNLRSDLDALRLIHGRAVDVAKVVEKAAQGPLSKAQLRLESLCRDYPGVQVKSGGKYGRDCLLSGFAVRELGLWIVKNREVLERDARRKSADYQRVMPKADVAAAAAA
ncbi:Nn.00g096070.m01.CDS01 [Neocucurbitaria sp. VM-36]